MQLSDTGIGQLPPRLREQVPAAPNDAYAACEWTLAHAGDINGDPKRVAVGSECAGGSF